MKKNAKILIVDDEKMNREIIAAHLSRLDYGLIFAADGKEALQKVMETVARMAKKGEKA